MMTRTEFRNEAVRIANLLNGTIREVQVEQIESIDFPPNESIETNWTWRAWLFMRNDYETPLCGEGETTDEAVVELKRRVAQRFPSVGAMKPTDAEQMQAASN